MVKQLVVYLYHEILLSKKEELLIQLPLKGDVAMSLRFGWWDKNVYTFKRAEVCLLTFLLAGM